MNTDLLLVTDVYPAREKPIQGVTGELIVQAARQYGHKQAEFCPSIDDIPTQLMNMVHEDDLVIFMGAGDIYKQIDRFITEWNKATSS